MWASRSVRVCCNWVSSEGCGPGVCCCCWGFCAPPVCWEIEGGKLPEVGEAMAPAGRGGRGIAGGGEGREVTEVDLRRLSFEERSAN